MARVVGTDPGTSSLDLLLLVDGAVVDQARVTPEAMRAQPHILERLLRGWFPIDLLAAPSGLGLPLRRGRDVTPEELDRIALVRPHERGRALGVTGFRAWVDAIRALSIPTVFLPGLIHLPTVPAHRKVNTIDLGTPDKLCVAALALEHEARTRGDAPETPAFAVVEVGSAFTAILVVSNGQLVDASAGTRGPLGLRSGGCWDGEVAYWRGPLSKRDLFRGGVDDLGPLGLVAFRESLAKHVAGLCAVTPFDRAYLSGAGLDRPEIREIVEQAIAPLARATPLPSLPGAWVKHAAQGSALLADGLAGGRHEFVVDALRLREARGSVLDWLPPHLTANPTTEDA